MEMNVFFLKKNSLLLFFFIISLLLTLFSCNQGGGKTSANFPLGITIPGQSTQTNTEDTNHAEIIFDSGYVYNFGPKPLNSVNTITLVIRNLTEDNATNLSFSLPASVFTYKGGTFPGTGGNCGIDLNKNSSCSVVISFSPTAVSSYVSFIQVNYIAGTKNKSVKFALNGQGVKATLNTNSNPYTFTSTVKDSTTDAQIVINNIGGYAASTVTYSSLSAPFYFKGGSFPGTGGNCSGDLSSASSCTLSVQYNPTTYTTSTEKITASYFNGDSTSALTVTISGTGITQASLSIPAVSFGTSVKDSTTLATVIVSNTGQGSASSISTVSIGNSFYDYSGGTYPGVGGNCGTSLLGGHTCRLALSYIPTSVSNATSDLKISYTTEISTLTVTTSLTGKTAPELSFTQSSPYDMGICPSGTSCTSTVNVNYVGYSGASSATSITARLSSSDPTINFEGGTYPGTNGTCGTTLTFGLNTCRIVLEVSASNQGAFTNNLEVSYSDGTSILDLNMDLALAVQTYYNETKAQFGSVSAPTLNGSYSSGGNELITGIAIDGNGNSCIAGYTDGDIDGSGLVSGTDIFALCYDSNASPLSLSIPTPVYTHAGNQRSAGAAYDFINDRLLISGDTDTSFDDILTGSAGTRDFLLTLFDGNTGAYSDSTQIGSINVGVGTSTGDEEAYGALVGAGASKYYIFGSTKGNLQGAPQTKSSTDKDAVLLAFDSMTLARTGTYQIAIQQVSSNIARSVTGDEIFKAAAMDFSGNLYLAGTTTGDLTNDTNAGKTDVFLSKFNKVAGTYSWISQLGKNTLGSSSYGTGTEDVASVLVDSLNNIYVVGTTTGTMNGTTNAGNSDIFVSKFLSNGTYVRSYQNYLGSKGSGTEVVTGASLDSFNNIYITGHTNGCLTCTGSQTSGGGQDIFIAKFLTENSTFEYYQETGSSALGNQYSATRNSSQVSSTGNIFVGGYTDLDFAEVNGGSNDAFLRIKSYQAFTTNPSPWLTFNLKGSNDLESLTIASQLSGGGGADTTIDLYYVGAGVPVTISTGTFTSSNSSEFNFKGGSFPGTGGTCAVGAMSSNCKVVVSFIPTSITSFTGIVSINYTSGLGNSKTVNLNLSADGI